MKRTVFGGIGTLLVISALTVGCATAPKTEKPADPAENAAAAEKSTEPEKTAVQTEMTEEPAEPVWTAVSFGENLSARLNTRDYEGALALFDSMPPEETEKTGIRKLKVSVQVSAGKLDEARSGLAALEAEYPDDTEILYAGAMIATASNNPSKRLEYLNRIIKINPADSGALTDLGIDLMNRKNYPQAKTYFLKAMASDADNVDAILALSRVYYMTSDLEKARDTLNLAISKEPSYSSLWAERARVESELGEQSDAIRDIEKANELNPTVYGQWIDYGNYLLPTERRSEAEGAFGKAIELEPDQYLAYIYRAGLRDELGNAEGSISDYRNVIRVYPQYYYAAESLGILLWGKGDYVGASEAFTTALQYNPKSAYYALMKTVAQYRSGREAEAKTFMSKYLTTLDRNSTEYFLCRLFVDKSGDADVINRIMKEKNATTRSRYLFYTAVYFDLFANKSVAQKYYVEVLSAQNPAFFEYRLSKWALEALEGSAQG